MKTIKSKAYLIAGNDTRVELDEREFFHIDEFYALDEEETVYQTLYMSYEEFEESMESIILAYRNDDLNVIYNYDEDDQHLDKRWIIKTKKEK